MDLSGLRKEVEGNAGALLRARLAGGVELGVNNTPPRPGKIVNHDGGRSVLVQPLDIERGQQDPAYSQQLSNWVTLQDPFSRPAFESVRATREPDLDYKSAIALESRLGNVLEARTAVETETVVLVGSGPSAEAYDVAHSDCNVVVGCNDTIRTHSGKLSHYFIADPNVPDPAIAANVCPAPHLVAGVFSPTWVDSMNWEGRSWFRYHSDSPINRWARREYEKLPGLIEGMNTTLTMIDWAVTRLGAKQLILIGFDFCFVDQKAAFDRPLKTSDFQKGGGVRYVDGPDGCALATTPLLMLFRRFHMAMMLLLANRVQVVNVGNGLFDRLPGGAGTMVDDALGKKAFDHVRQIRSPAEWSRFSNGGVEAGDDG